MNYLPSKRVLVAFALSAAIVSAGIYVASDKTSEAPKKQEAIIQVEKGGGGDWQKTVAKSPVAETKENALFALPDNRPSPFNELLSGYASAAVEAQDYNVSDETRQTIAKQAALEAIKLNGDTKDPYKTTDLAIDNSISVRDYFNEVGRVIKENFPEDGTDPNYENEVLVIYEIANRKQPNISDLATRLERYQLRYANTALSLKAIKVPEEAAPVHLSFVNSFANTATSLLQIQKFSSDPMIGVLGMQNYQAEAKKMPVILKSAKALAKKYSVVFASTDPGYELQLYLDRVTL